MNNDECSICLEDIEFKDLEILSCNHKFHKECIEIWRKKNPICPYCRKFLKSFFETNINYYIFKRKCNIFIDENNFKKITLVYNYPFSNKPFFIEDIKTSNIKTAQIKDNTIIIYYYYKNKKEKRLRFIFKKNEANIFMEKIQSIFTKNFQYYVNDSFIIE